MLFILCNMYDKKIIVLIENGIIVKIIQCRFNIRNTLLLTAPYNFLKAFKKKKINNNNIENKIIHKYIFLVCPSLAIHIQHIFNMKRNCSP